MKLRTKFILLFVMLIIVIVGGLMYYVNFYVYNNLRQSAMNNARIVAELSESAYFIFTDFVKTRAVDWSSDRYIKSVTENMLNARSRGDDPEYRANAKAFGAYLREEKLKYDSNVIIVDILDGGGSVIASSREGRIGINEREEEERFGAHHFSEAARSERPEAFVSHVISEMDESDMPMIHAVARVFSSNKNADGSLIPLDAVLLIHFSNIDTLGEILSGRRQMTEGALSGHALYDEYQTAEIYLVNSQHLMISPSRFSSSAILKQRVDVAPVHDCFNNKKEIADEYINYRSKVVIGASMCLVRDNLVLIAEVEKDEILRPVSYVQWALALSGVAAAALGAFGVALLGYVLLRPLLDIAGTAKEVASGNLRARAAVKTNDEIGHLATVFNRMLENINESNKKTQESSQALKREVAELEKFKKLTVGRELKMVEMKKKIKELGGGEEY